MSGASVDPEGLAGFLCLNYVPGDRTLLAGVRRLAPATWRRYGRRVSRTGVTGRRIRGPETRAWATAPGRPPARPAVAPGRRRADRVAQRRARDRLPLGRNRLVARRRERRAPGTSAARLLPRLRGDGLQRGRQGECRGAPARPRAAAGRARGRRRSRTSSASSSTRDDPLADSSALAVYASRARGRARLQGGHQRRRRRRALRRLPDVQGDGATSACSIGSCRAACVATSPPSPRGFRSAPGR